MFINISAAYFKSYGKVFIHLSFKLICFTYVSSVIALDIYMNVNLREVCYNTKIKQEPFY